MFVSRRGRNRKLSGKRVDESRESILEIIRVCLIVTFSHFEEYPVDDAGDDAAADWSDPVHLERTLRLRLIDSMKGPKSRANGWLLTH